MHLLISDVNYCRVTEKGTRLIIFSKSNYEIIWIENEQEETSFLNKTARWENWIQQAILFLQSSKPAFPLF